MDKKMIARITLLRNCARAVAFVILVFTFTVATFLTLDWYKSGHSATVRSEVLERALAGVRENPQNTEALALARELDRLARHTYFNSLTFRQNGMVMLVMSLLLTAASFGLAWRLGLKIPDPRAVVERDPARSDRLAVQALLVAGTLLTIFAVTLQVRHSPAVKSVPDRELRASLTNKALTNGQQNVCACMLGVDRDDLTGQWPNLRGPLMTGRVELESVPLKWDGVTDEGVKWKVELSESGFSTPVLWNDKIFLTTGSRTARRVWCYSTQSGEQLWMTEIPDGAPSGVELPEVTADTGFAASSPACDDQRVYVIFASGDLAALDHSGAIVWSRYLGRPANSYGHASSLTYQGSMLLIQWDQDEDAEIMALNTSDGATIWKTERAEGMSWSTPIVMQTCDKPIVLIHACDSTWGVELATGSKLWDVNAVGGEIAPSITWENDTWVAANCYSRMVAYKLNADPVLPPKRLWLWEDGNLPDVASPVMSEGLVYYTTDAGEVACHDLKDGKLLWIKEFDNGYYASPIIVDGRLYAVDREKGDFRVFETGREAQELALNPMGEGIFATPVFVEGSIYVRGTGHLWRIVGMSAQ
jgi:outer membrane protein assembly factor BamB